HLLPVGVKRRHLRCSSRSPVQRMKCHHNMFLSPKITKLHSELLIARHRRQIEVRGHVSNFHRHHSRPSSSSHIKKLRATFRPPLAFLTALELDKLYVLGFP